MPAQSRTNNHDSHVVALPDSSRSGTSSTVVELAATADEARRRMSKKKDVKSNNMSMRTKYDIFQKL